MPRLRQMRFSGVNFKPLVSAKEINSYVDSLSQMERESMFEVAKELESKGMIEILGGPPNSAEDDSCL